MIKNPNIQKSAQTWHKKNPSTLALDTEFIWRSTYWPKPALLQFCHNNEAFLLDPLNASIENFSLLKKLLNSKKTLKILHAAHDDLVILKRLFGAIPDFFVDTQFASLFCGSNMNMGLDKITASMLGIILDKSCQDSNWLKRPLSKKQIHYALQDVAYLEDIWSLQYDELKKRNYLGWLKEDMAALANKVTSEQDPWESWRSVPPRSTSAKSMAYAQALSAWREIYAQEVDKPIQHILSHNTLALWCESPLSSEKKWLEELQKHNIFLDKSQQEFFLSFLEKAKNLPEEQAPKWPHRRLSKKEDFLIKHLKKELKNTAEEIDVPEFLIASRKELVKFIWRKNCRLNSGWRFDMFGKKMLQIL